MDCFLFMFLIFLFFLFFFFDKGSGAVTTSLASSVAMVTASAGVSTLSSGLGVSSLVSEATAAMVSIVSDWALDVSVAWTMGKMVTGISGEVGVSGWTVGASLTSTTGEGVAWTMGEGDVWVTGAGISRAMVSVSRTSLLEGLDKVNELVLVDHGPGKITSPP